MPKLRTCERGKPDAVTLIIVQPPLVGVPRSPGPRGGPTGGRGGPAWGTSRQWTACDHDNPADATKGKVNINKSTGRLCYPAEQPSGEIERTHWVAQEREEQSSGIPPERLWQ
jgi:hypothetical protein